MGEQHITIHIADAPAKDKDHQTIPPDQPRKRGKQAFEHTHKRVTLWMDKKLEKRFEALSKRDEVAKSTLLDEAIRDLLEKRKA